MKKTTNSARNILAIVLAILLMFSFTSIAFAENEVSNEIVASVSIAARVQGFPGHVWLYIENISDKPIEVGHYTVPVNEGVSIGLLSVSVSDGWGIYYNIESYCNNKFTNNGCYSLTESVTIKELETISESIKNYMNHWDPVLNCVLFATNIWNSISDKKLVYMMLPLFTQIQISIHGGKANTLNMYFPSADKVYRQNGTGSNATLIPVSSRSLDKAIG